MGAVDAMLWGAQSPPVVPAFQVLLHPAVSCRIRLHPAVPSLPRPLRSLPMPQGTNYLAVLVCAVIIFMLGGLWYSPMLFAKRWVALQGKTMEEMQAAGASPRMYFQVFLCGLVISSVMATLVGHFANHPM